MITSIPTKPVSSPPPPSVRDVKFLDDRTQRRVLELFQQEQRVRPAKLKPSRADVHNLTATALYVLQLFAQGLSVGAVAESCNVDRNHIVRFRGWVSEIHGLDVSTLRLATDRTTDGLRSCVVSGTFRRPAIGGVR